MSRQIETPAVLFDEELIALLEEPRSQVAVHGGRESSANPVRVFAAFTRAELDPVDVHPVASNREAENVFALGQVHLGFDRIVFIVVIFAGGSLRNGYFFGNVLAIHGKLEA